LLNLDVTPQPIIEHNNYKLSIIRGPPSNCPNIFILTELYGECAGYRHRFEISNYEVAIPFRSKSTDTRVGFFYDEWKVRSGKFFTMLQSKKETTTASFAFKGATPTLSLNWGTCWMNVPKQ